MMKRKGQYQKQFWSKAAGMALIYASLAMGPSPAAGNIGENIMDKDAGAEFSGSKDNGGTSGVKENDPAPTGAALSLDGAQMDHAAVEVFDAVPVPMAGLLDVLDLKQMEILDVLKLISQKSGINIIAGQEVKGRVTVFLKNVEVREALRMIVSSYGWAFVEEANVLRVMTAKEFSDEFGHQFGRPMETRILSLDFVRPGDVVSVLGQIKSMDGKVMADENTRALILVDEPRKVTEMARIALEMDAPVKTETFRLSYAKVQDIALKVNEWLTPSVGTMKHDERSNSLVVSDTPARVQKIEEIIRAFDQKDKEVLIEAKIIQVGLSDGYKFGIDWQAMVSDYHDLKWNADFDVLSETEKRGSLGIGTFPSDGYTALLEALQTVGQTDILSSPRITAVNNHEAKIMVGSTEPYVTTTTTTPASGPATTAESVNFIEVGVKLFVTPTIHQDDFITMKIKPEVSSVTRNVTTGNNNTIPVVETSEAETTVIVKDQVTIVIGGLIKDERIRTVKKVPGLGSIPLLGRIFGNQDRVSRKTEIVILLTPRIVSGDENQVFAFPLPK